MPKPTTPAGSRAGHPLQGGLCYIDAVDEPHQPTRSCSAPRRDPRDSLEPLHLCRLRYFGDENSWSMAFYTYSHNRYEPCNFENGSDHGTPEEAYELGALYLRDR